MNVIFSPVAFCAYTVQYFLWFVYFRQFMECRYSTKLFFLYTSLLYIPYYTVWRLLPGTNIAYFLLPLSLIYIFLSLLFKASIRRKLVAMCSVFIPLLLSELFFSAVILDSGSIQSGLSASMGPLQQIAFFILYLCFQTVLLTISMFFWRRLETDETRSYPLSTWALFLFFPCSQFFLTARWYIELKNSAQSYESFALIVTVLLCIAADIALLHIIIRENRSLRIKQTSEAMEQLLNLQSAYYPALETQYEDMRKLRHDLENHMYTINLLLENNSYDDAKAYARELSEKRAFTSSLGSCQNPIVDTFLHYRAIDLKTRGITLDMNIYLTDKCGVENSELISAFGNLIDNAAEACIYANETHIILNCTRARNYIKISTENHFTPNSGGKLRRIKYLDRGLGTQILQDLAKKYDGEFYTSAEDNVFHAVLLLKENN